MSLYNGRPAIFAVNINSIDIENNLEDRLACMPQSRVESVRGFKRADDKRRSCAAFMLLETVLGKEKTFRIEKSAEGKPFLPDGPQFSISHSGEWALAAFCESPVGIDIERHKTGRDFEGIAGRFFHPDERKDFSVSIADFYDIWTLKESYIKMLGSGFSTDPRSFCVKIAGKSAGVDTDSSICMRLYDSFEGYSAAVCSAENNFPDIITILSKQIISTKTLR